MDHHDKLLRAQRKVEEMTAFYVHLAVFVVVMALLVTVNAMTVAEDGWWVQWPLLGWGLGVLAHHWAVFGRTPAVVTNWQLRKIRELKERM